MRHQTRRDFLKQISAVAGSASVFPLLPNLQSLSMASESTKKPNIIFILSDDHRWDALGCMGNNIVRTPNIDDMAAHGAKFENMFVTISICAPSRACFLTGEYAQRHGVHNFGTSLTPENVENSYPVILRKNGYYTGFVGKYGIGSERAVPKEYFDYWNAFAGQGRYEVRQADGSIKHMTWVMRDQALEFLDQCPQDKPFCLSLSFKAPHAQDGDSRQFIYDPEDEELYKDVTIPPPVASDPSEWEKYPAFFTSRNEARNRWQIRFSTPELYQKMVKGYYRLITEIDMAIGEIRDKLKEKGVDDNTVIFYSGDNGFFLGEHGMAGKWYAYEQSIRVPLIYYDPRWPESLKGRQISEIALNVDVAPTILSIAGVDIPEKMQGQNLLPLLENKPVTDWRQDFYYEHLVNIAAPIPPSEAVVSLQYKYIIYPNQNPAYEELFDLQKDPYEQNNLAGESTYQELLENMRLRLKELRQKAI